MPTDRDIALVRAGVEAAKDYLRTSGKLPTWVELRMAMMNHIDVAAIAATVQESSQALDHDIEAYRGALGYSVSGEHDGRLSDGTLPVNGIADALHEQLAALRAENTTFRNAQKACEDCDAITMGEVEALRRDAERLNFMEQHKSCPWWNFSKWMMNIGEGSHITAKGSGATLREAIDDCMKDHP